jgi:hypothetical protein
MLAAID